jgi:hypothetical protein
VSKNEKVADLLIQEQPKLLAAGASLLSSLPSCLSPRMGIGFSAGSTFAPSGLEGFRPAFLYIGANELPLQSDGGGLEKSSRGGWHNLL